MSRNAKIFIGLLLLIIVIAIIFWWYKNIQVTIQKPAETPPTEATSPKEIPTTSDTVSLSAIAENIADTVTICSFNIQFLGNSKKRDNAALAALLKDFEVVVVQEMVAAPKDGIYPDGSTYKGDIEVAEFIAAMTSHGFSWVYSEEDTGTGDKIHQASSSTEWWIAFFKPQAVLVDTTLPHGFLAADRSNNADFERVPYAFSFRTTHVNADFSLVSVHLQPGEKVSEKERRKHELASIATWIDQHNATEKDIIVLGDMNIYSQPELVAATPVGYKSLNYKCVRTNTLINADKDSGARPYDHVLYNVAQTGTEIDTAYGFQVLDLITLLQSSWKNAEPYPGKPYNHNAFRSYYSDHHPIAFQLIFTGDDDK